MKGKAEGPRTVSNESFKPNLSWPRKRPHGDTLGELERHLCVVLRDHRRARWMPHGLRSRPSATNLGGHAWLYARACVCVRQSAPHKRKLARASVNRRTAPPAHPLARTDACEHESARTCPRQCVCVHACTPVRPSSIPICKFSTAHPSSFEAGGAAETRRNRKSASRKARLAWTPRASLTEARLSMSPWEVDFWHKEAVLGAGQRLARVSLARKPLSEPVAF